MSLLKCAAMATAMVALAGCEWEHPFTGDLETYPQNNGVPLATATPIAISDWGDYDTSVRYNNEGVFSYGNPFTGFKIYWCGKELSNPTGESHIFSLDRNTGAITREVFQANCSGFSQGAGGTILLAGNGEILEYDIEANTLTSAISADADGNPFASANDITQFAGNVYFTDNKGQQVYFASPLAEGGYSASSILPEGIANWTAFLLSLDPDLNSDVPANKQKIAPNGISVWTNPVSGETVLYVMGLGPGYSLVDEDNGINIQKEFPLVRINLDETGVPDMGTAMIYSYLPEGADGGAVGVEGTLAIAGFRTGNVWVLDRDGVIRGEVEGPVESVVNTAFEANKLIIGSHNTSLSIDEGGSMPLYELELKDWFFGSRF